MKPILLPRTGLALLLLAASLQQAPPAMGAVSQVQPRDIDLTYNQYSQSAGNLLAPTKHATSQAPNDPLYYSDIEPCFAADQHTIYFSSNRPTSTGGVSTGYHLWSVDSDGSYQQMLPLPTSVLQNNTDFEWPAISTDGNKIAYSASDAPNQAQIHIINIITGIDYQVTTGPGIKTHPTWSPSGLIAFQDNETGANKIWVLYPQYVSPPQGQSWVISGTSARAQLSGVAPWDAGALTQGYDNPDPETGRNVDRVHASDTAPSWEPSGVHLLFTRFDGVHKHIWMITNIAMSAEGNLSVGIVNGAQVLAYRITGPFNAAGSGTRLEADEDNASWRPEGPLFAQGNGSNYYDNRDNDAIVFQSTRKSPSDPNLWEPGPIDTTGNRWPGGATSVGSTYGIYRMPIVYYDSAAATHPYTELAASQISLITPPPLPLPSRPAPPVVIAEDTQNPPYQYNCIAPVWAPTQYVDSITSVSHIANRTVYATDSGKYFPTTPALYPNYPNPLAITDLWSTENLDFTPPALLELPTVTPQVTTPGQTVTISVRVADSGNGVGHVYVQLKNPNSYLQMVQQNPGMQGLDAFALRNGIGGQNVSLSDAVVGRLNDAKQTPVTTDVPVWGSVDMSNSATDPAQDLPAPVVFDGHRLYQIEPRAIQPSPPHPAGGTVAPTLYHTVDEVGYQPINPSSNAADPNAWSYQDVDPVDGTRHENIPFDMYTLQGQENAILEGTVNTAISGTFGSAHKIGPFANYPAANGSKLQDFQPNDTLELFPDPTDPSGTLYTAQWQTDPNLPTDYLIDVIAVDKTGNCLDYDNVGGFSTQTFPAGKSSILLVADYTTPQQFIRASGIRMNAQMFGVESWLTDNPLSKIGVDPATGGTLIPPLHSTDLATNYVDLMNLVTGLGAAPAGSSGVWQPGMIWGVANTLGLGSWIDLGSSRVNTPYATLHYVSAVKTDTKGPEQVQEDEAFWPARENNFDPNNNLDSYDIWRVICRGGVTDAVMSAYGPTWVQEPGYKDVTVPVYRQTHSKCVIWASPYTSDEVVGPGTISDADTQEVIGRFLDSGGRMLLTGQDVAWALSANGQAKPTGAQPYLGPDFLQHYFGVTFAADRTTPLGDNVISGAGPIGSRWTSALSPLNAMSHYNTGSPDIPMYNTWTDWIEWAAHDQDYPDDITPVAGWNLTGGPTGAATIGSVTVASDYTQTTGGGGVIASTNTLVAPYDSPDTNPTDSDIASGTPLQYPTTRTAYSGFGVEGFTDGMSDITWSYMTLDPTTQQPTVAQYVREWAGANKRAMLIHGITCWMRENTFTGQVNVLNASGNLQPLANALVVATEGGQIVARALSRSDGSYTLSGVPTTAPGSPDSPTNLSEISAIGFLPVQNTAGPAPLYETENPTAISVQATRPGYTQIHMTRNLHGHAGEPSDGPILLVSSAPPGTLEGLLTDTAGNPIVGATVTLHNVPFADTSITVTTTAPLTDSSTGKQYNYQITNVPATPTPAAGQPDTYYYIDYSAPGYLGATQTTNNPGGGNIYVVSSSSVYETFQLQSLPFPTGLTAQPGVPGPTGSVVLTWTAPTETTGHAVEYYNVYRSLATGGPYNLNAQIATNVVGTTYTDTNLTNGVTYYYVVTAVNIDGESVQSSEANATPRAPARPQGVTGLTATARSQTQIDLGWVDNNNDFTLFKIYRAPDVGGIAGAYVQIGTAPALGTVYSYSDLGLTANTKYWYEVVPTNAQGDGPASNQASATTFPNAPGAPTGLTATPASATEIDLNWNPPAGGGAQSYIVYAKQAAATQFQVVGATANTTFPATGLVPQTPYTFYVTSANVAGSSGPSTQAQASTLPNPPAAPTGLSGAALSQTQVKLSWSDQTMDASSGFVVYRLDPGAVSFHQIGTTAFVVNQSSYTYVDATAIANTSYYYQVVAKNAGGVSSPSGAVQVTTLPNAPGVPINLTAQPVATTQIKLAWASPGGQTGYIIQRKTGTGAFTTVTTITAGAVTFIDSGLSPSVTYTYELIATNAAGQSAPAGPVSATTFPVAPAAPAMLSATAVASTQVNLTWAPGDATQTGYTIQRKIVGGVFAPLASPAGNATSYSDTTALPNTSYIYEIAATNAGGVSAFTVATTVTTPPNAPAAPLTLSATAISQTTITLQWTPGDATQSGFVIYRKVGAGAFVQLTSVGAAVTSYQDNTGQPSTTYTYEVMATNGGGSSSASPTASATTFIPAPAAPNNLTATVPPAPAGQNEVDLAWTPGDATQTGFVVERSVGAGGFSQIGPALPGTATSYQDLTAASNTTYVYRVRATNSGGSSLPSNTASATTLAPPPASPTLVGATGVSSTQANVTWVDNTADFTGFQVTRSTDGVTYTTVGNVGPTAFSFTDNGLTPNTTYYYEVIAVNGTQQSPPSTPPATVTLTPGPPLAPVNATATASGSTQINLTWVPGDTAQTGFVILRKIGSAAYAQIANVGPAITSYQDNSVQPNTSYTYEIVAYNLSGQSQPSVPASITTPINMPGAPTLSITVPAAPTGITQLNLTWTGADTTQTGWILQRKTGASGIYATIATPGASTNSYSDQGLTADTTYFYTLTATNAGGQSPASNEVSATTLTNPPSAPALQVSVPSAPTGASELDLSWTPGDTTQTGWILQRRTGAGVWIPLTTGIAATATNYQDKSVVANTSYSYQLIATNPGGQSPSSNTVTASTLPNPPATPLNLTAAAVSQNLIELQWTPGDNTQTGYQIERQVGSGSLAPYVILSGSASAYSDTNVQANTTYQYVVLAINAGGSSGPSNVASATTSPNAPGMPTNLAATAVGASAVNLTWAAPAGGTETGYLVQRENGSTLFVTIATVDAATTSYTDSGLTPATTYTYQVTAYNQSGTSPASNSAVVTTLLNVPASPLNVTATAVSASKVTIAWSPGDQSQTSFKLLRKIGSGSYSLLVGQLSAQTRSFQDQTVVANTTYTYEVIATNSSGDSQPSIPAAVTTPSVAPAAPVNLSASAVSPTLVSLTWTAGDNTQTGYTLQRRIGTGPWTTIAQPAASDVTYQDQTVTAATSYSYQLFAVNSAGSSPSSNSASVTTPVNPPAAPLNLKAVAVSQTSVQLTWAAGDATQTGYLLMRRVGNGAFSQIYAPGAAALSYTDTTTSASMTYTYEIFAVNGSGQSAASNLSTVTTPSNVPGAPINPTATAISQTSIRVAWTPSDSLQTGFVLQRKTGNGTFGQLATLAGTATSYTDTGLSAGTVYSYQVIAKNATGSSPASNTASATTFPLAPAAPTNLTASAWSTQAINLAWKINSTDETGFKVEIQTPGGGFTQVGIAAAGAGGYRVIHLTPGATYTFRVRSTNAGGDSSYTNTASATTQPLPPAPPVSVTVAAVTSTSVRVTWQPAAGGAPAYYVDRAIGNGPFQVRTAVMGSITTFVDTGLTQGQTYVYRVRSFNSGGAQPYGPAARITMPIPPAAPTGLVAAVISSTAIRLNWVRNSTNETAFIVERSSAGSAFQVIDSLSAGSTAFMDSSLSPNTAYSYRVKATNLGADSAYTNTAAATTLPSAPQSLTATPGQTRTATIVLSWNWVGTQPAGFVIERSTGTLGFNVIGMVAGSVRSYTNSKLTTGSSYTYRVLSYTAQGYSQPSVVATAVAP